MTKSVIKQVSINHQHLYGIRERKYNTLLKNSFDEIEWKTILSTSPTYLFIPQDAKTLDEYKQAISLAEMMNLNGQPAPGIVTTHDEFAISWTQEEAKQKVYDLLQTKDESEARKLFRLCSQKQWVYKDAVKNLSESDWEEDITQLLYRPFDFRWTIFNRYVAVHRRERVMQHILSVENIAFIILLCQIKNCLRLKMSFSRK